MSFHLVANLLLSWERICNRFTSIEGFSIEMPSVMQIDKAR